MSGWKPPAIGTRASLTRTFSTRDVEAFAALSGDHNPLHFDAELVGRTSFGRLIVHGGLTTGLFNALVAERLPGPGRVFLHQEWDYPAAVGIGEAGHRRGRGHRGSRRQAHHRLRCRAWLADGTEVLAGESLVYTVLPDANLADAGPDLSAGVTFESMRCPKCGTLDGRVIDSRDLDDSTTVRRRRECSSCRSRYTTYERVESARLIVLKSNGTREEFDRDKLADGISPRP